MVMQKHFQLLYFYVCSINTAYHHHPRKFSSAEGSAYSKMDLVTKTPVAILQEFALQKGFALPNYQITFQVDVQPTRFDYLVKVAELEATGSGASKKIGKQMAAKNALMKLEQRGFYVPAAGNEITLSKPDHIVDLQSMAVFNEISCVGPPHRRQFTFECKLASYTSKATGRSKKIAKQLAAKNMINLIKDHLHSLALEQPQEVEIKNQIKQEHLKFAQIPADEDPIIKIEEMGYTLARLMHLKNLTYKDFEEDLKIHTEASLFKILDRLEVKYSLVQFQKTPVIVSLSVRIETPITVWGGGEDFEEAKKLALKQIFLVMEVMLKMKL